MPVVSSLFMKMKIQVVRAPGKSKSYPEGVTETGRLAVSKGFGLYELVNKSSLPPLRDDQRVVALERQQDTVGHHLDQIGSTPLVGEAHLIAH